MPLAMHFMTKQKNQKCVYQFLSKWALEKVKNL